MKTIIAIFLENNAHHLRKEGSEETKIAQNCHLIPYYLRVVTTREENKKTLVGKQENPRTFYFIVRILRTAIFESSVHTNRHIRKKTSTQNGA